MDVTKEENEVDRIDEMMEIKQPTYSEQSKHSEQAI